MAWYKYSAFLAQNYNSEFDQLYNPGATTRWSGIYRCHGCGREVVSTASHPLPPQNHHQHTYSQGPIQWRLTVTDAPDPA